MNITAGSLFVYTWENPATPLSSLMTAKDCAHNLRRLRELNPKVDWVCHHLHDGFAEAEELRENEHNKRVEVRIREEEKLAKEALAGQEEDRVDCLQDGYTALLSTERKGDH